jgi:hypothetical protein
MAQGKPNPRHLVAWAIGAAFFSASSCLLTFLPIPRLPVTGHGLWAAIWMNRLRIVTFFTPFLLGICVSQWAERRFKRGLYADLWSESELQPAKSLAANPAWRWTSLLLFLSVLTIVVVDSRIAGNISVLFYAFLFPTQAASRIRQLLTPRVKTTGVFMDWNNSKPIQSEHWGEQPAHPSD